MLKGERSGLWTRMATMDCISLCEPMKSSPRFWNWNRRSALPANYLATPPRFLQTRSRQPGLESGGGHFPARFFVSSGPAIQNQRSGEKERRTMNQSIQLKRITSSLAIAVALLLVHSKALAAPSENT